MGGVPVEAVVDLDSIHRIKKLLYPDPASDSPTKVVIMLNFGELKTITYENGMILIIDATQGAIQITVPKYTLLHYVRR